VLVKWWLLAIPQYIVLGFVTGGAAWTVTTVNASTSTITRTTSSGASLITVLAVFAGIALLFGHRYPRGLFDLVVGFDRWVLRVVAYVALMTDQYPPFRLDQGGEEPARPSGPGPADPTGSVGTAAVPPQVGPADLRTPR
jgi:hypothetical protein